MHPDEGSLDHVVPRARAGVIGGVEREAVVHRKGATPAGAGVLGIIPAR